MFGTLIFVRLICRYALPSIVAIVQQARQAAVLGRLSLCMCLWRQVVRSCFFIVQLLDLY